MNLRYAALAALTLVAVAPAAAATDKPSQLIVFGDSLVDAGNLAAILGSSVATPAARGYFQNRFTNGPDFTDLLSQRLYGTYQSRAYGAGATGTNYAVGGARGVTNADFAPDLASQLAFYRATKTVDPNALYILNFGGNDVFGLQNGNIPGYNPTTFAAQFVTRITTAVSSLSSAGATRILVMGVPNTTPTGFALEAQLQSGLDALALSPGTSLERFSYQNFFLQLAADPLRFGVPPITQPGACFNSRTPAPDGSIDCSGFGTVDNTHPTAEIHRALFRQVAHSLGIGAVPEPATWALLIGGFGMVGTAQRLQRRRRRALAV